MHGPRGLTVGISGALGSGKSTLASALAEALDGRAVSFGSYVAHLADPTGGITPRRVLQDLGEDLVRTDPTAFVNGFLAWAGVEVGRPLIVDGVRHLSVDHELRHWATLSGRPYVAVSVSATPLQRAARRTDGDLEALAILDRHPVELEAASLSNEADVAAPPDWDLGSVVDRIQAISEREVGK